jgi:hypothetical protein
MGGYEWGLKISIFFIIQLNIFSMI